MREDRASTTAITVAFARGFSGASTGKIRDPYAARLLPGLHARLLRLLQQMVRGRPRIERVLARASVDMLPHAALRTDAIDAAIDEGVARGARQLVIVGAGLDARAYRLASLSDVRVFEVDHPATQRLKLGKTSELSPIAEQVLHVAVDFGRDSLAEALDRAGHDAASATIFLWEGVTMYLPLDATRGTLDVLSMRSAPGSRLIVSYIEPRFSSLPEWLNPLVLRVFALVGEPMIGAIERAALRDELARRGYSLVADTDSHEWLRTTAYGESLAVHLSERVAVAERP